MVMLKGRVKVRFDSQMPPAAPPLSLSSAEEAIAAPHHGVPPPPPPPPPRPPLPPLLPPRPPPPPQNTPRHLIIGDSLVKGLNVPGSTWICKGGIRPGELLQLLPGSIDNLHPEQYNSIRSVTVIVGTNALNVKSPGKGMPFLDVVHDFEKLIRDIKDLFPYARIGLYNVLPRAHMCIETVHRIQLFNTIFDNHLVNRLKNVVWIKHYWEFLDQSGSLRNDIYGKLGIHLKGKGKAMMVRRIRNFQNSYY